MRDFRKLRVLNIAHGVTLVLYRVTESFPTREVYGLTAQMRRAAGSVGANISEACGKTQDGDFARYLSIAAGSSSELRYQILLAKDLGYMAVEDFERLDAGISNVLKMLHGLIKTARPQLSEEKRGNLRGVASTSATRDRRSSNSEQRKANSDQ